MSRPLDRTASLPELGKVDRENGEFWAGNAFTMIGEGNNLSAYERNRVFLNTGDGKEFLDASFASAADIDSDSRSAIVADFDRDGWPDLLVGSVGGGRSVGSVGGSVGSVEAALKCYVHDLTASFTAENFQDTGRVF